MVTKQKFISYLRIQRSGLTNMFDVRAVCDLSGKVLTKEDCIDIMSNYDKYMEQWADAEDEVA